MSFANEILDAIEIMVKQVVEDNTTKIYTGICKTIATSTCVLTINGKDNTVKYYGGTPTVGTVYQVFIPFGNMSAAFIIVPGAGGQDPETGVSSANGKTGAVVLTASDVGALPNTTTIPTKTSQLDNDSGFIDSSVLDGYAKTTDIPTETSQLTNNSGFITANDVPVKSVDGSTGTVVTNAVKTTFQSLTDAQKAQARTNIGAGTSSFDGDYESLSNKPTIPTKVSQLENDSNYATESQVNAKYTKPTTGIPKTDLASDVQGSLDKADTALQSAPVTSVNTKTGAVVLTQDDVGDGSTYVRTHNDFTDAAKTQINTNEDNIAILDSDMGVAQADITTLKGNVSTLTTALGSKQDVIAGGASTITDSNLTANRALISNASGKVAVSLVTSTELSYLNGITSNIQTQLDKKLESAPVTSVNGKTGVVVLTATDVGALSDTTIIPIVNDATLDVQRNGVSVGTFTANASTDKTINITVPTKASDVGALPDTTSIPSKTSELDNDSGFITSAQAPVTSVNTKTGAVTLVKSDIGLSNVDNVKQYSVSNPPPYPVTSVNGQTGAVSLGASDVGAVSTSDVTTTLGTSTTKVPSEKAVSDALSAAGAGDMLKATYDPDGSVATAGGIPAYVEANGGKIDTIKVNGTVQTITDKTVDITVPITKGDIGLGKVENIKQYSANNPPPYPVTSVNGQTGDVTVSAELPEHLVKYDTLAPIETTDQINADTLQGHAASYFATGAEVSALSTIVDGNTDDITANAQNISTLQSNISTLQSSVNGKVSKSGDTMTGALIAQNNTNYSVAQVRNIIISTSDPSGGNSGDIWIKYTP